MSKDDDDGWVDDAPPFVGATTEAPIGKHEQELINAVVNDDPERVQELQREIEAADRAVAEGMRFFQYRDPEDHRWDIVTVRYPNPKFHDPNASCPPEKQLTGEAARWRFVQFIAASAASVAEMLGAPQVFEKMCVAIYNEAKVQEISITKEKN